jgi:DNA-directed RNA polymerase II subunit RPB1
VNKLLNDICVKGIKEICKVYIKDNVTIETDGSNLKVLFEKTNYYTDIDVYNTISNDVIEVFELLGIEAARNLLLMEIRNVIEFDGSYVNIRHLSLLVDTMTYRGALMAITRHGINRADTGPLMRCSFEETVNVLTNAASNAQVDRLRGVTETIMLGKMSKIGTGFFNIMLNIDKLKENYCTSNSFIPSSPKRYDTDKYYNSYFPLKELVY